MNIRARVRQVHWKEHATNMRTRVRRLRWKAHEERGDTLARVLSVGLGVLMIILAFHWRDRYQSVSTVITSAIIVVCAIGAWLRTPWLRFVNTAAAVWLFFAPILMPWQQRHLITTQMWVSLVVLTCSFFPLFSVGFDEGEILPPVPHHA
jgi:hypothetical protein